MVKKKKQKPIMATLVLPLLVYLIVQMVVILLVFSFGGVFNGMKRNTWEVFDNTVSVRSDYLEKEMTSRWGNLTVHLKEINRLYSKHGAVPDQSGSEPFYEQTYGILIDCIKTNAVTGAFIILDNGLSSDKYDGLYLHCNSPNAVTDDSVFIGVADDYMKDLLVRKHPLQLGYKAYFELTGEARFFHDPMKAARSDAGISAVNCGYWSDTHKLSPDGRDLITYTQPMIVGGEVRGVFGIEVTTDYIRRALPYREIGRELNFNGTYVLAKRYAGEQSYRVTAKSGTDFTYFFGDNAERLTFKPHKDGMIEAVNTLVNDKAVGAVYSLKLYNNNTPFESEQWFLLGLIPDDVLFADYHRVLYMIILSFSVSVVIGVMLMIVLVRYLTRPIVRLSNQTLQMYHNPNMALDKTGIKELDTLVRSIEELSANVMENASKLSKVIELSGMPLAAFELNDLTQKVEFTDKFAHIIGCTDTVSQDMSAAKLREVLKGLGRTAVHNQDESPVFTFIDDVGSQHWISLRTVESPNRLMGVVEDITEETVKKNRIEYDRDFDGLTGLLNRRAFLGRAGRLFANLSLLKNAALIMMDLDNLKMINDTYGHSYGDEYIKVTARVVKSFVPRGESVGARMSGDEFLVLLYGYEKKERLLADVEKLRAALAETSVALPQRKTIKVRCSGGYACCPDDSTDLEELVRYADFAMYEIKRSTKGAFKAFDAGKYMSREYRIDSYEKLDNLIEKNLVEYKYQPIVSIRTGKVRAYEALMRSLEPSLSTPSEILNAAREQHKLEAIERLTMRNTMAGYLQHRAEFGDAKLFINSIPNQILPEEERRELGERCADVLANTVLEFTEEEKLNEEMADKKKDFIQSFGGKIAIDDFGAGYSNDTILLFLNPHYIKIDIYIVKGVNEDKGKQKIIENIVAYATERKIKTIAEGVETREELETVSALGVDYVQGFYVAGADYVPCGITPAKRREIVEIYNRLHSGAQPKIIDDEM